MNYVFRIGILTLALALVATVTFASGESDQAAAAAEKEMVLDPATGEMVEAPQYGGTLTYGRTGTGEHCDYWSISGWATHFMGVVNENAKALPCMAISYTLRCSTAPIPSTV